MASGGWLGNIISAPLRIVDGILGGGSSAQTYKVEQPQVRATDLVQETSAMQPEEPVMGYDQNTNKKKRGISSLYVKSNSGSDSYTGRSGL